MTRAETPGYIAHARLMLASALGHANDDWEDPDVQLSPSQVVEMRRNLTLCRALLKDLDPFVKAFEEVSCRRLEAIK